MRRTKPIAASLMLLLGLAAAGACNDDGDGGGESCDAAASHVAECFGGLAAEDEVRMACEDDQMAGEPDGAACSEALANERSCIVSTDCGDLFGGGCEDEGAAVQDACPSLDRDDSTSSPPEGECPYTEDNECDEPEGTNFCAEGTDVADCA